MTRFANLPSFSETEAERVRRSLQKPSTLDVQIRKHARKQAKRRVKEETDLVEAAIFAEKRAQAFRRDRGRDRVFGTPLKLVSDNPALVSHPHHVIFKSLGGSDELSNLATVSPHTHELIHRHKRLIVTGNADETLTCQLVNPETGRVLQTWESRPGERIVGAPRLTT